MSASLDAFKAYWETLTPEAVAAIGERYTEEAYFRDPFNEVRGHAELKRIFGHMFEAMHEPRFRILEVVEQDGRAFITWDFTFRVKAWGPDITRTIHGGSLLRFAADGRVEYHRDYWDAAGELYEKLPVVGALMRWLARKMG